MRSLVPQIRVVVVPRNDCEEEEHEMGPKQISISGVICNTTRTRDQYDPARVVDCGWVGNQKANFDLLLMLLLFDYLCYHYSIIRVGVIIITIIGCVSMGPVRINWNLSVSTSNTSNGLLRVLGTNSAWV